MTRLHLTRLASTVGLSLSVLAGCQTAAAPGRAAPERRPASALDWNGSRAPAARPVPPPAEPQVAKNTWVLHIGDSFVNASLQQNLGPKIRASGANYVVDSTTATYTTTWASDAELETWLARRPSLVIVTLGANEVDMPTPAEHAGAVEQLVRKIAGAKASCVWITPPMWKKDSGILQVIHDHSSPCLFFDSDAVTGGLSVDERQRDHIHPNEKGGARWSEAVWGWLVEHRDPQAPGWTLLPFEVRRS
jgi:lysophospholipase L1-like esterase